MILARHREVGIFEHSYIELSNIKLSPVCLTRAGKVGLSPRGIRRRRQQDVNSVRQRPLTGGTTCHIARERRLLWRRRRRSTKRPTPLHSTPVEESTRRTCSHVSRCQLQMWFVESWIDAAAGGAVDRLVRGDHRLSQETHAPTAHQTLLQSREWVSSSRSSCCKHLHDMSVTWEATIG